MSAISRRPRPVHRPGSGILVVARDLWLAALIAVAWPRAAGAIEIYATDFQSGAGPEWSNTSTASTPLPADGSRRFLGRFDDHTVTLSLAGIGAHSSVTLDLDFYAIGTWDGGESSGYGPDVWDASVVGGPTLLHTSFSNVTSPPFGIPFAQNYPDPYPGPLHAQFTGSSEARTLGYVFSGWDVSAVYHLSFTVPHTQNSIAFAFSGAMAQEYGGPHNPDEESWGLDNVHVSTDGTAGVQAAPAPRFALRGVTPNPAPDANLSVQFELSASGPVRLELLDVAGRRIVATELGTLGTGRHTVLLSSGAAVPPGLYLVRLAQGANAAVARVAVIG